MKSVFNSPLHEINAPLKAFVATSRFRVLFMTDKEMAYGLKCKNERVISAFYDKYAPLIYGQLLKGLSEKEASKLLIDIIVDAYHEIDTHNPDKLPMYSWLLKRTYKKMHKSFFMRIRIQRFKFFPITFFGVNKHR